MTRSATQTPLSFDEASQQLASAFARLEGAIAASLKSDRSEKERQALRQQAEQDVRQELDALHDENARLSEENVILSNKLQALQEDYLDLQKQNEHIASQIDRQVEQLELIAH